jgi:NADH-quinone oxidoreductase subunit N
MMVMLSANDFITLYMGLELQSLVIYVLAAFERDNSKSAEAGLKYFILGSVASGIMLYGISLIYGFSGTTNFNAIFMLYTQNAVMPIAVIIGLVMVLTALCFKISAAPFHMWTPDVYEGAPTIAVTFFATSAKVASSLLLIRFLMEPFAMAMDKWQQIIIFISIISMIIGAVSAIWQSNFKRLIAYSAITHIGYLLIGVATGNMAGIHAVLIYLLIYVITTLGIFALILMMTDRGAQNGAISALKGLNKSNPYTAFAIVVLMLSLSGIPPLAGFFGKFYLFIAALRSELYLLAATGIITSVIGSYYYLKIIRVMYFEEADAQHAPIQMNVLVINIVIMISVIFNLSFFLAPDLIIRTALAVASVLVQ